MKILVVTANTTKTEENSKKPGERLVDLYEKCMTLRELKLQWPLIVRERGLHNREYKSKQTHLKV